MRRLFVINPKSGRGRGEKQWPRFADHTAVTEWHWAEAPGHARQIASGAARRGFEMVVAVGGDGTVNEVINGILDTQVASRPSLGILACGTGDDFARSVGCPLDWQTAFGAIADGATQAVDLGLATGGFGSRAFGIAAFVGAGATMAREANSRGKALRGIWGYIPYLAGAARFRAKISLETEAGSWNGEALSVMVANASTGGGGVRVCPPANVDDGLLNVMIVEAIPPAKVVRLLASLTRGSQLNLPFVHHWTCRTATLSGDGIALALDGEIVGALPVDISVLPAALKVVVGRVQLARYLSRTSR